MLSDHSWQRMDWHWQTPNGQGMYKDILISEVALKNFMPDYVSKRYLKLYTVHDAYKKNDSAMFCLFCWEKMECKVDGKYF